MRADSLLQSVRRVDDQGERLLSLRTFSGPEPSRRIDVATATLGDLAELLRTGAPFPPRVGDTTIRRADFDASPAGSSTTAETDRARSTDLVLGVLEHSYERGGARIDDFEPALADRIAADDRLETVGSWVLVPLSSTAPYARNWWPVVETLLDRLEGVLEDFRRVSRRVRVAGIDHSLATGCETVVDMLETLSLVVRRADADSRYVSNRTDQRQGELLATIENATAQLRGNDDG
ncbi:hypothetical protein [Natronobacterium texcoconense]|uniref:Uncharacterized protein n=1 Tax=Natronobacterium texcoconense TaxID=1095778 RepID=A0A1H1J2B2_NATTX|nr:hypothetical protein [Natronobacterium texcoconense]SDR44105.1 hypothetical protein SAMN04489842_4051 [Natronobacterium texcoconense]